MSLTRRLIISFSIILLLSLISLLLHIWAGVVRDDRVALLQGVIRLQAEVNDLGQRLQAMHRKMQVVETLRQTEGAQALTEQEYGDIAQRLVSLREENRRIDGRLRLYLDETSRFEMGIPALVDGWSDFLAAESQPPIDYDSRAYHQVMERLNRKEWQLLSRSNAINQELRSVVVMTNRISLGSFLISIIITVLLAYHVIRYTQRSIGVLQHGTAEWGAGNLAYKVPYLGGELGQLAQSFNEMSTNLSAAMAEVRGASRRADAANQAKSSFLANMSHELRTPMNAIIGYSEMLLEEIEEDGVEDLEALKDDMRKILGAGRHLLSLINDVLDISKIESGKMSLYMERVSLRNLLEEVLATIRPLLERNRNKLEFIYNSDLNKIETDVTRFRQVALNLLSNAGKFTQDGLVTLEVNDLRENGQHLLEIAVADTGIGMSEGQLERVFEAFVQADLSTTKLYGGTGLGLTISKKFAELLNGDIRVSSTLGEGSRFSFILPVIEQASGAAQAGREVPEEDTSLVSVLVIDDDPIAQDISRRILVREGCRVYTAESGKRGIELAREKRPDVIVLDVMMPDMDGWQVLRDLRQDPQTSQIPVLMQSMLNERDLGLLLGADDYLVKPITREALTQAVKSLLPGEPQGNLLLLDSSGRLTAVLNKQPIVANWTVQRAVDPAQALEILETTQLQLIMVAPNHDDEELASFLEQLQAREVYRQIPLLLVREDDGTEQVIASLKPYLQQSGREAVAVR